jgi:protein CpxP
MLQVRVASRPAKAPAGLRMMWLGMLVAALAAVGVSAWAQTPPPPPMAPPGAHGMEHGMERGNEHAMGPGMHGGMGHGGMMFGGSPEHMGRMIDRMLDGLGTSDAQRAQIKQIATAAAADLKAQRQSGRALRERGMQIFAAPNVDAGAAEQLRQQMLAQHDQASKRVMQAMLDASRVLTPEQRAKLGQRMADRAATMQDRMQRMQQRMQERMGERAGQDRPHR